jgi:hypothetical protein
MPVSEGRHTYSGLRATAAAGFGSHGACAGIVAVADTLKEEAADVVAALKHKGIAVWMLTGDNERTANAIAQQVRATLVGRVSLCRLPTPRVLSSATDTGQGYSPQTSLLETRRVLLLRIMDEPQTFEASYWFPIEGEKRPLDPCEFVLEWRRAAGLDKRQSEGSTRRRSVGLQRHA